jgi:hypothetical protein
MVVISMAVLVAATAYWIAPDHSPDANRMILEIGGKKPGYTQQFMVVKKGLQPPILSYPVLFPEPKTIITIFPFRVLRKRKIV